MKYKSGDKFAHKHIKHGKVQMPTWTLFYWIMPVFCERAIQKLEKILMPEVRVDLKRRLSVTHQIIEK